MKPKIAVSYMKEGREPEKDRMIDALESWADVYLLDPEEEHPEIESPGFRDEYKLYHMAKTRNQSLKDLKRAEDNGIKTINPYSGAKLVDDRYQSLVKLRDSGLLIPRTEYGKYEDITIEGPWVTKPRFEGDGHIIELIDEMEFPGEMLIQEYIDYDNSLKLYKVGDKIRSVELKKGKNKLDRDYNYTIEFEPDDYLIDMMNKVSDATGLKIFETDVIEKNGKNYIVDINSMVGLQNVSDAVDIYNDLLREEYEKTTGNIVKFFPNKEINYEPKPAAADYNC